MRLLRNNQINRTKKFYLFRDFLICSCGTPMGGRIKTERYVQVYYCPLSERKFNNSYKKDVVCSVKRNLNIPRTDEILWNRIVDILSDTIRLKDGLREKTNIGRRLKSTEIKKINDKISHFTKVKNQLEKGLVSIESNNILNKFPSEDVYKSLKGDLTKKYNITRLEIESLHNSLSQIGKDEQWFTWVDKFGVVIQENRDVPDSVKKDILRTVLDNIIVDYDKVERVHRLIINFRIPVIFRDEVHPKGGSQVVIKPPKSGRKPKNQLTTVGNYSTVTDLARFLGWSTLQPLNTAI